MENQKENLVYNKFEIQQVKNGLKTISEYYNEVCRIHALRMLIKEME